MKHRTASSGWSGTALSRTSNSTDHHAVQDPLSTSGPPILLHDRNRLVIETQGRANFGRNLGSDLRCLVDVEPPGFRRAARIAWLDGGLPEDVPIGDPMSRLVPARDPVVLCTQHAIEGPTGHVE